MDHARSYRHCLHLADYNPCEGAIASRPRCPSESTLSGSCAARPAVMLTEQTHALRRSANAAILYICLHAVSRGGTAHGHLRVAFPQAYLRYHKQTTAREGPTLPGYLVCRGLLVAPSVVTLETLMCSCKPRAMILWF